MDEHAERPAVDDDLVHADEQEVFLFGHAHQARPNEGAMREIEGMKQFFLNKLVPNRLPLAFRQLVQIVEW